MIRGRAVVLGDDVDSNMLAPGSGPAALGLVGAAAEEHATRLCLSAVRPGLREQVRPGDILIAGRNLGQGSQRDRAVTALMHMGFRAIVAESLGRLFFRNCIALGLPAIECPGVRRIFQEGDPVELDMLGGTLLNVATQTQLAVTPLTPLLADILLSGGLLPELHRRFSAAGDVGS